MKTLADIITELQQVDQTTLENAVAGLNAAIADLQAYTTPAAPTATSVAITFSDGSTQTVPAAQS